MTTAEKTRDSVASGQDYRFERFRTLEALNDLHFSKDAPGPGEQVPKFGLPTLDDGTFKSDDLSETGPVLLVFGSLNCPMTDSSAPGINELYRRFGDRVRFVLVAIREAHPGSAVPQPRTFEDKVQHAEMLRDFHGHQFEVAVDDIDGTLHRALSPKPNSAYILNRNGTIVFRAHLASDTNGLAEALASVVDGNSLRRSRSRDTMGAMMRMFRFLPSVLDRAGRGAWRDMWRAMPPMAIAGYALKVLGISGRKG